MRVRATTVGLLLAAALAATVQPSTAAVRDEAAPLPPIPRGRALAALAEQTHVLLAVRGGAAARRLLNAAGGHLVSAALGLWQVDGGAARTLVPALAGRGLLRYAEPDRTRRRSDHLDQGDPLLDLAWQIERVGADEVEPPGPGAPLTIIDTGVDLTHPEFAERPDLVLLTPQSTPEFGEPEYHGTIVTSTAGAPSDGIGTVGIYPRSLVRSYDLPDLEDSSIIAGIDAAVAAGPSVINLSIGGPGYSRSLYEAVMRAVEAGSVVVGAAGNDFQNGNPAIYPADYPHVLTVGATDKADHPAPFTSASLDVDLVAPGIAIPVQNPADPLLFGLFSGTSFAAPIVSATVAWLWTERPDLEPSQLAEMLRRSARDLGQAGHDTRTGFGLLSIPAALSAKTPPADPLEPNDDVDLITSRGIFGVAKPPLTGPGSGLVRVRAGIAAAEDPGDVYRVYVPAGTTLDVRVTPSGDVGVTLWHPRTESVHAGGVVARRNTLASSDRRGAVSERLRWRNASAKPVVAYLEVRLPRRERAAERVDYSLRLELTKA